MKDTPKIDVHSAEGRRSTLRQPTFFEKDVDVQDNPGHVPMVVSPFLAWDILDEFGESDKVSIPDRVDRFLKAIYSRVVAESKIEVERKTEDQVQEYLQTINQNSLALELAQNFRLLFQLYIPNEQHSDSDPIEMYWGAVYEIVQVGLNPLKGAGTMTNT